MKKLLIFFIILVFISLSTVSVFAQEMMDGSDMTTQSNNGHTTREEARGKIIWDKLQAKELNCEDLSDDDFGALGEYYMGQIIGNSHGAMNDMMIRTMGEESEKEMHIVMSKRLSGCDTSATFPVSGSGFMPMMQMLAPYGIEGSGWGMMGDNNSMMENWGQNSMWGGAGSWFVLLVWLVWFVVGILAIIWLWKQIIKKG